MTAVLLVVEPLEQQLERLRRPGREPAELRARPRVAALPAGDGRPELQLRVVPAGRDVEADLVDVRPAAVGPGRRWRAHATALGDQAEDEAAGRPHGPEVVVRRLEQLGAERLGLGRRPLRDRRRGGRGARAACAPRAAARAGSRCPSGGTSVANWPCSPRCGPRWKPVTADQKSAPASWVALGRSMNATSQSGVTSPARSRCRSCRSGRRRRRRRRSVGVARPGGAGRRRSGSPARRRRRPQRCRRPAA